MLSTLLMLVCLGFLLVIFYQDLRYRAVSWILFPLSALALGGYAVTKAPLPDIASRSAMNLLFIALILVILFLFFFLKYRKASALTDALGPGDILFFLVTVLIFSPLQYMLFFCVSLFLTAFIAAFIPALRRSIPLAGAQAIMLAPLIFLDQMKAINLSDDNWILEWLI